MIVIPMAGLSSRFFKSGYKVPKYMLDISGFSLFSLSVYSFKRYFDTELFVFICRDIYDTGAFVKAEVESIGIKNYKIILLSHETKGQAETVLLGLQDFDASEKDITIFNIDTIRPNFSKPNFECDGYLETFLGEGDNWSNVLPDSYGNVLCTAEKQSISKYCCTGLYHFLNLSDFRSVYSSALVDSSLCYNGEIYVAPLYNKLIDCGKSIKYTLIDKENVVFCGVPEEYEELNKNTAYFNKLISELI